MAIFRLGIEILLRVLHLVPGVCSPLQAVASASPWSPQEAVRVLCRCREDAQLDLARARHRLIKFLVRRGRFFNEGYAWSQRHRAWLHQQQFERDGDRAVFEDQVLVVDQARHASLHSTSSSRMSAKPLRIEMRSVHCAVSG